MTQAAPARAKIPTKSPQPARSGSARPAGRAKPGGGTVRAQTLATGSGRAATRGGGEVIGLDCGITVYPARSEGGRWRAARYENDVLGAVHDGLRGGTADEAGQAAGHAVGALVQAGVQAQELAGVSSGLAALLRVMLRLWCR